MQKRTEKMSLGAKLLEIDVRKHLGRVSENRPDLAEYDSRELRRVVVLAINETRFTRIFLEIGSPLIGAFIGVWLVSLLLGESSSLTTCLDTVAVEDSRADFLRAVTSGPR